MQAERKRDEGKKRALAKNVRKGETGGGGGGGRWETSAKLTGSG